MNLQKNFYEELYAQDEHVQFTLENKSGIKVPEDVRKNQEEQVSLQNIQEALLKMNNNKTPGQDGISADFYKVFWNKIKFAFHDMVLQVYEEKDLHQSARQGILNLIPKSNKDTRFIKNLRPITLLNVDYKIIEKAIANKMIPALNSIIHTDQRGFMKDRRISVNIRKMLDIMHMAEKQDMEAVILSLDFVKCFDKCSFSILHGSLNYFEFGSIIKEWTKILYKNFTVKVQNNGNFSEEIDIKKGVHQGGCCSSIYFLVIAEILAISLRDNEEIEGITIEQIRNILNQFADDMDVFSMCTEKSIRAIYRELDSFHLQSGFQVSYDKTTLYRIGSLQHSSATMYDLTQYSWSNRDITVLGVTIAHEDIVEKNYGPIVAKVKKVLNAWYNRNLTLIGKVQVINTLVASLFVYKMMVLPIIPSHTVKLVDNIIRNFLWNGKKAKVAYTILQNKKSDGGLNLVNLRHKDIALKATWPIILNTEPEYAALAYTTMKMSTIQEDIWRCNLNPEQVAKLKIRNQFWKDVLISWSSFNYFHNHRVENQLIWYNRHIVVGNETVMWNDTYLRGLKYVHQLFTDQKFKSHQQVWEEFGLTTLRYNSLKKAIPGEWKVFFQNNGPQTYMPIPPHNYDVYKFETNLSAKIYKLINSDLILIHNKYVKWGQDLGTDISHSIVDFGLMHRQLYSLTNVPKIPKLSI